MHERPYIVSLLYNIYRVLTNAAVQMKSQAGPIGKARQQGRGGVWLFSWLAGILPAHAALVLASGLGIANEPGPKFGAAAMAYYAGAHWEAGYLNEGVNHGTDGVFAQYRLTRSITKRLLVTLALGPEVLNTTYDIRPGVRTNGYHPSLLVSLSASYRLSKQWRIGVRWNHITFQQSAQFGYRDADMAVLTVGYGR